MKISRIAIDNYKSIKHLDFYPSEGINAFIGANSAGKSNIFDAINWLLGPVYPSFNSTKKEDHFLGDDNNKIKIRLEFDDGHTLELNEYLEAMNYHSQLEVKSGLFFDDNTYNCKGDIREQYCSAYLGVDRKILDYLPSNRWSLVGRILQEINRKFLQEKYTHKSEEKDKKEWLKIWLQAIRDKLLFSVKDDSGQEVMKKFMTILQEESAKQLNRPISDFIVDLSLYDPWNFYRTLQLIVKEQDMDLEFQASNLGMGVQASISIAILKAYSEINLANRSPIFIDEPELYLHPQAQRNFYEIIKELSEDKRDDDGNVVREGTQIFYNTHSPNFLSTGRFHEIFLVRKNKELGTYVRYAKSENFVKDLKIRTGIDSSQGDLLLHYQNAYENTGDTQKANEGFFAKKIVLVEGQSEVLVLPLLLKLVGYDVTRECISIVRCGCKDELDRFFRLYTEFGIPCYLIFDGDKHLIGTEAEDSNLEKNKTIFNLFGVENTYPDGIPSDYYLGFEDTFETNLGIAAPKKGLDLFMQIKDLVASNSYEVPSWIEEFKIKLDSLPSDNIQSILKTV